MHMALVRPVNAVRLVCYEYVSSFLRLEI